MFPIPAEYQFVVALAISLCVGGVGVWNFLRGLRAPPPAVPVDLKILGAAFSDAQALRELVEHMEIIAAAAREMKAIRDKEAERDIHRWRGSPMRWRARPDRRAGGRNAALTRRPRSSAPASSRSNEKTIRQGSRPSRVPGRAFSFPLTGHSDSAVAAAG